MAATIEVRREDCVWAALRIRNAGEAPLRIHNPGNDRPTEGWQFSTEAYQVAVLRSFHFLEMTLRTQDGSVVEPAGVATRADHEVGLPVELEPDAELQIRIPLHEFYDLKPNTRYSLALSYGDDLGRVSATTQFSYP